MWREAKTVLGDDAAAILDLVERLAPAQREQLRLSAIELRAEHGPLAPRAERLLSQLIEPAPGAGGADAQEARLIEKLAASGQLRRGYLLRALSQGRLGLFVKALARLGGYEAEAVARAVGDPDRPELLALACAGIGIDRSAFPTVLERVRAINGGAPGGGEEGARRAMGAFAPFASEVAAQAFRRAMAPV